MKMIWWFIFRSLELDWQFCLLHLPDTLKLEFLLKKYYLLVVLSIKKIINMPISGKIHIFGRTYHFNDQFGISFLQSVYVDNAFMEGYIKKGSTIIDIGANIGQFNFFSYSYLSAKHVCSVEPIEEAYRFLKKNDPSSVHLAVGISKTMKMHIPQTTLLSSFFPYSDKDRIEVVPGMRLDDIDCVRKTNIIDLLKIDTEGSEYTVLISAKQTLKKCRYVLIEASLHRPNSGDLGKVISYLTHFRHPFIIERIGRQYEEEGKITSVDILFKQKSAYATRYER